MHFSQEALGCTESGYVQGHAYMACLNPGKALISTDQAVYTVSLTFSEISSVTLLSKNKCRIFGNQ